MNNMETTLPNEEANWEAMDIYLFSNGQQYSPPRKYHLQANELMWWESTLNYLARSHYGSSCAERDTFRARFSTDEGQGPCKSSTIALPTSLFCCKVSQQMGTPCPVGMVLLGDGDGTPTFVSRAPPGSGPGVESPTKPALAHMHEGISHAFANKKRRHTAIDLYTLNGHRIEGPLELKDGMPYVAVVPPDAFIETGYEKYLIKASRSWEKRLAKKKASANDTLEEKRSDCGHAQPCCSCPKKDKSPLQIDPDNLTVPMETAANELTTIKTPDDNIAVESVVVKPRRSSTLKTDRSDNLPPRSIIASPRISVPRYEKRRSSGPHTAFAKTPSSLTSQLKRNSNSKQFLQRRTLTKIPVKINQTVNGVPAASKIITTTKVMGQKAKILNNRSLATDSVPIQDIFNNKDIVVISTDTKLYKSVENEIKSMELDPQRVPIDEMISCYIPQTGIDIEAQTHIQSLTSEKNTSYSRLSSPNSKIKVLPVTGSPGTNINLSDIPVEDNYIALINKGDAVKLNLNIELQHDSIENTNSIHKDVRKASSLMNVFNAGKSLSCNDEETIVHSKSLQSIISGINETFAKVIVVQCGCCGNNTAMPRFDTMPVYKDDNGFFILMPNPALGEDTSCSCGPNHENIRVVKKTMSERCLRDSTRTLGNPSIFLCVARPAETVMTVAGSMCSQTDTRRTKESAVTKQRVSINEDLCNEETCGKSHSQITENIEYFVTKGTLPNASSCDSVESYTQTDWCSVLLEARRHDDGRFSFHLPPLHVLKYNKL